ncbi:hypothetical protein [Xanthomonas arboricola]|uniref:hypothetical protein n=1 Tax=Xanthomonas arboricola TaxID=56448 RepID=UPI0020199ED4|nr:hypothetical protein [Xanthomonas arboricola]MDN0209197.1 hypothetical protein [Xanthomonas arboricola pv. corylina]MDN0213589.1 hypothetical protein [Xanthomonas arboricola pv. corylina]UQQ09269.1 hypothetical protein KP021_13720 [Xanthomonas arboricola pv. corylina]
MKIGVIISTIVFGMSLASHTAGASNITELRPNDPWCNPSYCYPPPGYGGGGSGSTTGSQPEQDKRAFIQADCREPIQERYAKVLQWYVSLPESERLWWYQIGMEGQPSGAAVGLAVVYYVPPGTNHGEEAWEIVDPYAAIPIAPTPLSSEHVCWLLNNPLRK